MRNPFTWLALGGVIAVALAATLDAVRSDDPTSSADTVPPATVAPEANGEVPLPPCTDVQLALTIDYIDAPAAVLRHVGGGQCRQARLSVTVRILTRNGRGEGLLLGPEGSFGGLYSPGVESIVAFRYSPKCGERGPFTAVVRAGIYSVRKRIPVLRCNIATDAD